jgi:hypothetical protein
MARAGNRRLLLGVILLILVLASAGYVWRGLDTYAAYQESSAAYAYTASGGISINWSLPFGPARLLPTAFYTNLPTGIVTVRYKSAIPQDLHISVSIPTFTQNETVTVAAGPAWQTIPMKPPLLPGALDSLFATQRAAQVILQVTDAANKARYQGSQNIVLLSRQEMLWRDAQGNDNSALLAAWVTPLDPSVEQLVSRAAAYLRKTTTPGMIGYHNASAGDVINQVDAIFDALNDNGHGVRYANEQVPYQRGGTSEIDETIKLPKDVLRYDSGMCVETTLTMAAALVSIDLRPYVVIVPGHAFLGVALGSAPNSSRAYWETSLLGRPHTGEQAYQVGEAEYQQKQGDILKTIDIMAEINAGIVPME